MTGIPQDRQDPLDPSLKMALKRPLSLLHLPSPLRTTATHFQCTQCRSLHRLNAPTGRIPQPTPFVPDVQTFLTLIGRNLSAHAAKIPSWEALFSLSSQQLKESGVEPARARKYLLWWRDRFRNGIVGIGGDMENVRDGVGELQIVEVPSTRGIDRVGTLTKDPGMRKIVINTLPPPTPSPTAETAAQDGSTAATETTPHAAAAMKKLSISDAKAVMGMRIAQGVNVAGTGVQHVKGREGVAKLVVQEGLWEQRRGKKVDGGERRKAMVRAKRRAVENKAKR